MLKSKLLGCVVPACLIYGVGIAGAAQGITLSTRQKEVGKYEKLELAIEVGREYRNPFDPCEVEVNVLIAGPGGRSLVLPAFYGQNYERQDVPQGGRTAAWYYPQGTTSWKARFAPMEVGAYVARASLRDRQGEVTSAPLKFDCVASSRKGFVRMGTKDPRFLEFTEGEPFFVIGQNVAFVGETQYVTPVKAEQVFGKLAANGANFVRLWTCCQDWALAIEAQKSAWTRSWTRESPVVPVPDAASDSNGRKCIRLKGDKGASLTASPSHPIGLRPGTRYVFAGRFRAEGCKALRVQVGNSSWEVSASSGGSPDWQTFRQEFGTSGNERWLGRVAFSLVGPGTIWLDALSLKEAAGGAELLWEADVNRPSRGYYNPLDCFMLDQIIEAAEQNGIYLMLCAITRDLYMNALSKVDSPEYRLAVTDAKKFMRYAVARWGYSTSVAAWEYWNEMDPGKPTDRFYAEVGNYLAKMDLYNHLRTTSTWAPSARDCRHPQLDIAQEHHYMRPGDDDFKDEVESIIRQTRFLRDNAPGKPALIGEFGLADAKWGLSEYMKQDPEGIHFHNCLWASALAGTSGTAMFWWWDQLDRQDAYRHYKPLTTFLAGFSPAGLQPTTATTSEPRLRIVGQQANDRAYLWLTNRQAVWWNLVVQKRPPEPIDTARITVEGLEPHSYVVLWSDTQDGEAISKQTVASEGGRLQLAVPPFTRDIACKIVPTSFAQ
ncbi:MAG: glycoside hydrolase family 5 protein [Planctomycetes bacterium]|nr:glycoside hydrolase family 5 protein [Planctomycetota bacterium]